MTREKVINKVTAIVADMQEEVDKWKDYSDSELRGGLTCDCDWWHKTLQTLKDALALLKALDVTPEELERLKMCRAECKIDCLLEHYNKVKDELDAMKKAQEEATIKPMRIDLEEETKAWLDKMGAVDALGNIADICIDWDGYRTADSLGGLVNEIWAYARYCADRLAKAQEHIEARLHLCESCMKEYPECDVTNDGIEFGCGAGNDNIIGCTAYMNRWKAQEPAKPYAEYSEHTGTKWLTCGACEQPMIKITPDAVYPNYCPNCGRKVWYE